MAGTKAWVAADERPPTTLIGRMRALRDSRYRLYFRLRKGMEAWTWRRIERDTPRLVTQAVLLGLADVASTFARAVKLVIIFALVVGAGLLLGAALSKLPDPGPSPVDESWQEASPTAIAVVATILVLIAWVGLHAVAHYAWLKRHARRRHAAPEPEGGTP